MKKVNLSYLTLIIAASALLSLIAGLIISVVTHSLSINLLFGIGIFLAIAAIPGIILVIIETAQEKRASKPDNDKATTVTRGVGIRIKVADEDVSIEAPDAESAIKVLQEIHENAMKHENLLKAQSQGRMEQTKSEAPDE